MGRIIRLRGHHISSLGERMTFPEVSWILIATFYGIKHANKSKQFFSGLSGKDTGVEIISGLDNICELDCPFYQYCDSNGQDKRYLGIRGRILYTVFGYDPDEMDEKALQKYNLKVEDRLPLTELMLKYYDSLKS